MHHSLDEYREARPSNEEVEPSKGLLALGTRSVLRRYHTRMTPTFLRRTYPGLDTEQLAVQRMRYGAIWASLIGAMTGIAMTVGDLGISFSFGLTLVITLGAVLVDALLFIRQQIRTVFDLSVIYGTPLDPDDSEDCTTLYLTALGASTAGAVGTGVLPVAHRILEAKGKNLLGTGVRGALRALAARLGGIELAKKLGERAVLRATLPVLSILIGAIINLIFSKAFSSRARRFLKERAIVVRPLLHFYTLEPGFDRALLMMLVNTVINEVRGSSWTKEQEEAVRHSELFLRFRQQDHDAMLQWVERGMPEDYGHYEFTHPESREALRAYLGTFAQLDSDGRNAKEYRTAIKDALDRLAQPSSIEDRAASLGSLPAAEPEVEGPASDTQEVSVADSAVTESGESAEEGAEVVEEAEEQVEI